MKSVTPTKNQTTAYVCENFVCQLPTTDVKTLAELLTRGPAGILSVLLLARWAGCAPRLHIVPLFETLADLDAAPRILGELFSLPVYRAQLERCGGEQMVMIGYSDSNKDGGYLAASWVLYRAQASIARVCADHGVEPRPVLLCVGAAIVDSSLEADARTPRPACSIRNKV